MAGSRIIRIIIRMILLPLQFKVHGCSTCAHVSRFALFQCVIVFDIPYTAVTRIVINE